MVSTNNAINKTVGATISGVTNTFTVTNASNTASSQATTNITVGGGTAGDVWTQHTISGTNSYAHGIDNSDSDSFKINTAAGSSVNPSSGTNLWKMTTGGIRTMPLQPAFLAYNSVNQTNVTGDNTIYTITFNTEAFDRGANFAANTFTAPVTGIYYVGSYIVMTGINAAHVSGGMIVESTANSYVPATSNFANAVNGNNDLSINASQILALSAGDTVNIQIQVGGGAKVVNVIGGANKTIFFGYLVE